MERRGTMGCLGLVSTQSGMIEAGRPLLSRYILFSSCATHFRHRRRRPDGRHSRRVEQTLGQLGSLGGLGCSKC